MSLADFSTLASAQAHFDLGRVNKNDFANHDATHDVERILDDALALTIPAELRKVVRVFRKIINGLLDNPNVGDAITQAALTALVETPDDICAYTQVMRNHLEELSKTYPYVDATEHDFQIAKGSVNLVPVTNNSGHIIISISADVIKHNPRLVGKKTNPRTGKVIEQRINNFYNVASAGKYDCLIPAGWGAAELFVDDVYGAISNVIVS